VHDIVRAAQFNLIISFERQITETTMSDIPGLNRPGSIQHAANDPTHPNQTLYHSQQNSRVYCWINFFLHLGQVAGLGLPKQIDYTPSKREREKNLKWLEDTFEINRPETPLYQTKSIDPLYDETLEIFVFHSDCMSTVPTMWGERIRIEWECERFSAHKIDSVNPLRIAPVSASQPGTITTDCSKINNRWAVRIYSQYEAGNAVPNRESEITRVKWFEQCMKKVAEFARAKDLHSIGVPKYIGCVTKEQKVWVHYCDELQKWCKQNSDLKLTIYQIT